MEPERWAARPQESAPAPPLRQRLWWAIPSVIGLLSGVAFVLTCAAYESAGHPAFAGKACFAATIIAMLALLLVAPSARWAVSPLSRFFSDGYASSSVLTVGTIAFAIAPTAVWIVLATRWG